MIKANKELIQYKKIINRSMNESVKRINGQDLGKKYGGNGKTSNNVVTFIGL
ncbi:hypothetical protein MPS01_12400 [Marinilactibacillus psychrotolerans]|uniref:Uncharacterized protein n=1 Tax=Marinilactibacillus psychrotolerans TaxID=191770 RepID=A0AAV3WSJ6_9LACT|nr:hypothetical protein [Marinilactibacillus psychrotolerans]GEL67085.1 hypothetical protein MPS01_12400 [Marinilactibacillus psychrotolerans]GEQ36230.1 hypothetical protein M132T_17380 [Marinilactibacillus psychrotolerans]